MTHHREDDYQTNYSFTINRHNRIYFLNLHEDKQYKVNYYYSLVSIESFLRAACNQGYIL